MQSRIFKKAISLWGKTDKHKAWACKIHEHHPECLDWSKCTVWGSGALGNKFKSESGNEKIMRKYKRQCACIVCGGKIKAWTWIFSDQWAKPLILAGKGPDDLMASLRCNMSRTGSDWRHWLRWCVCLPRVVLTPNLWKLGVVTRPFWVLKNLIQLLSSLKLARWLT